MKALALSLIALSLWSCGKNQLQSQIDIEASLSSGLGGDFLPDVPDMPDDPLPAYKPLPLAWESSVSGSAAWSKYVYTVIKSEEPQMLGQNVADDVETFCPKYRSLHDDQRANFWGQLFAGMAKYESGWKPTSWMTESTMGIDPVTGVQVKSEGLLQLSYQDQRNYNMDCGFDWTKDKKLTVNSSQKTIFSPYKNLRCGIKIFARQLKNKGAITLTSGVYWSVLKRGGTYSKISQIATITKSLGFCN